MLVRVSKIALGVLAGLLLTVGCGVPSDQDSASNVNLSKADWTHVGGNITIAVDKYFSGSSSANFYSCLRNNDVKVYIATYNTGLTGGSAVDTHLRNAQASGLELSAYFAFNSEHDLTNAAIDEFLRRIRPFPIKTVWLDIERPARNIDSLTSNWYDRICREAGYACGVYTNHGGMGAAGYPTSFSAPLGKMFLWYALWDGRPTTQGLKSRFYGWNQSHGKQFANGSLCGTEVDMNAFESRVFQGTGPGGGDVDPPLPPVGGDEDVGNCVVGNLSGSSTVRLRARPTTLSDIVSEIADGTRVQVKGIVGGEPIFDDLLGKSSDRWGAVMQGDELAGFINDLYLICN